MRFLKILIFTPFLAACVHPNTPTEQKYTDADAFRQQNVQRCRVLDVREVRTGAQQMARQSNPYGYRTTTTAQTLSGPGAQTGAGLGAILGAAAANKLGNGNELVTVAGVLIGAAAGTSAGARYDRSSPTNVAIEYSIIQIDGRESVIVQPWSQGDRIVPAGSTCRLANSESGTRVLPGEHLPGGVNTPKQTRFN
jgi:outer membrane lipoprotein SlyB